MNGKKRIIPPPACVQRVHSYTVDTYWKSRTPDAIPNKMRKDLTKFLNSYWGK